MSSVPTRGDAARPSENEGLVNVSHTQGRSPLDHAPALAHDASGCLRLVGRERLGVPLLNMRFE